MLNGTSVRWIPQSKNSNASNRIPKYLLGKLVDTGKTNSPFSAKHYPFSAQTTSSLYTIPVLGLILPFTAQLHSPFSVFVRTPTCSACYKIQLQDWHQCGMARCAKLNHEASPEMTMFYHKDWFFKWYAYSIRISSKFPMFHSNYFVVLLSKYLSEICWLDPGTNSGIWIK